eukprot:1060545-Prymnesium_polylepis.1
MWSRRPGGWPFSRHRTSAAVICTHHAASVALERRGQHTGLVSRRADVPGECRVARAHEDVRLSS